MSSLRRPWRPDPDVPIADALEMLLDHLEGRVTDVAEMPSDPFPLSSGVDALDRVCNGGLRIGWVTLVEADLTAQARALTCAVARQIDHPVLLATASVSETTCALLAGAAAVPAALIRAGRLSMEDWAAIGSALAGLAACDITLTEATLLGGVAYGAASGRHKVLLVDDISRFGPMHQTLAYLGRLASTAEIAVLATTDPVDHSELPAWALERTTQVTMAAHGLGSRAALLNVEGPEGLQIGQVEVECLLATVQ